MRSGLKSTNRAASNAQIQISFNTPQQFAPQYVFAESIQIFY